MKETPTLTLQQFASLGGKARWQGLGRDQRAAIARKAVQARWAKRRAAQAKIISPAK